MPILGHLVCADRFYGQVMEDVKAHEADEKVFQQVVSIHLRRPLCRNTILYWDQGKHHEAGRQVARAVRVESPRFCESVI